MAISRNIKSDRGLTFRMLMTGFFLVLLYGLVVGILIAVGISYALVLVIALVLIFCQYWFSAKIAMYAMHAKEVTPEQAPELHGVVDRLCALADMPKPKVGIATTDIPNAFATGRSPKSSVVCVTSGLLRRLDEPEVEAVLSHELSHVAHRDVRGDDDRQRAGHDRRPADPGPLLLRHLRRRAREQQQPEPGRH